MVWTTSDDTHRLLAKFFLIFNAIAFCTTKLKILEENLKKKENPKIIKISNMKMAPNMKTATIRRTTTNMKKT